MADIRPFIRDHLLEPLKNYPTVIQDTMVEIITQKLQLLYDYALKYPEIVSPNKNRLDILKAIADQFVFTVREEADIQEQIDILDHILHVYSKRGSVESIENMWKYYGGELPKDVRVVIPSYKLFRYSISKLSGTHVFQDNEVNRTGVYEIKLINNHYPIPELKEFLLKELVAAGNLIYFTDDLHLHVASDEELSNPYKYIVEEDNKLIQELLVLKSHQGLTWSGYNAMSIAGEDHYWSGRGAIFIDISTLLDLNLTEINTYLINRYYELLSIENFVYCPIQIKYKNIKFKEDQALIFCPVSTSVSSEKEVDILSTMNTYLINRYRDFILIEELVHSPIEINSSYESSSERLLYCTPTTSAIPVAINSYNNQGDMIETTYKGYFVLGETHLGSRIA